MSCKVSIHQITFLDKLLPNRLFPLVWLKNMSCFICSFGWSISLRTGIFVFVRYIFKVRHFHLSHTWYLTIWLVIEKAQMSCKAFIHEMASRDKLLPNRLFSLTDRFSLIERKKYVLFYLQHYWLMNFTSYWNICIW